MRRRGFGVDNLLGEITGGLPQIHLAEALVGQEAEEIIRRIDAVRKLLLNRRRLVVSFTGGDAAYEAVRRRISEWATAMPSAEIEDQPLGFAAWTEYPREGLAAPMDASYCAMVMPAPHISEPDAAVLSVASRLLSLGYVLEEVRFKGTAYGGGCSYNSVGRTFSFHSYRDPWINQTLDVYRGAARYVKSADWTQADVDRAIIGTAKEGERPIRPGPATGTALWRYLMRDTAERREQRHAAMLASDLRGVKRVLEEQFSAYERKSAICVVSSRERLEAANQQRAGEKLEVADILR